MENKRITKRSEVGFGYTSACEQVWNKSQTESSLRVCDVTEPIHVGTFNTVSKAIEADRTYQSIRSGGTSYRTAWFVKVAGVWRKVADPWFAEKMDSIGIWRKESDAVLIGIE